MDTGSLAQWSPSFGGRELNGPATDKAVSQSYAKIGSRQNVR